jgi:hypothetical protein
MNRYEPSTPRAAMGLTAVAMAAVTIGAMVVLPAKLDSVSADPYTLAAAKAATMAPIEVAISPARIGVPEVVNREEHGHPGRTTLRAQEIRGERYQLSSRAAIGAHSARTECLRNEVLPFSQEGQCGFRPICTIPVT